MESTDETPELQHYQYDILGKYYVLVPYTLKKLHVFAKVLYEHIRRHLQKKTSNKVLFPNRISCRQTKLSYHWSKCLHSVVPNYHNTSTLSLLFEIRCEIRSCKIRRCRRG